MKLYVGLGNPGEKYERTRHNAGFMAMDKLAGQVDSDGWKMENKFNAEIIKTDEAIYAKPLTFMNESGRAVAAISRFFKIPVNEIYVFHDDLDLSLGSYKIQHAKGPLVHYGINSIEELLGSDKFWRVRIGVENREIRGNKGIRGEEYSLQNFSDEERLRIDQVIATVVNQLVDIR